MKYIKTLESNITLNLIDNDYYKIYPHDDIIKFQRKYQFLYFTKDEIKKLSQLVKDNLKLDVLGGDYYKHIPKTEIDKYNKLFFIEDLSSTNVCLYKRISALHFKYFYHTNKKYYIDIIITKYQYEWYLTKLWLNNSHIHYNKTEITYLCDQFEAVFKFIDDIINNLKDYSNEVSNI